MDHRASLASSSDMVLMSSDNISYPAHRQRLAVYSRILEVAKPLRTSTTIVEPPELLAESPALIQLEESGDVIELLLQFMDPRPQPDLKDKPFPQIAALVKAVEKYEVFAATSICEDALSAALEGSVDPAHAVTVLCYGINNHIVELMNKAAPFTLSAEPEDMFHCLSPLGLLAWSIYRGKWEKLIFHVAMSKSRSTPSHSSSCTRGMDFELLNCIPQAVLCAPPHVSSLLSSCSTCYGVISTWADTIRKRDEAIPCFSQFLAVTEQPQRTIAYLEWDLILVSADGVSFNFYQSNLSAHSAIFADAAKISNNALEPEPVTLSETADVLELLLKFMYRQPQPSLDNVPFATIADLVKAAEKYEVIAALHRSEKALRKLLAHVDEDMAHQILAYAVKHNDPQMALQALAYAAEHDDMNLALKILAHGLKHNDTHLILHILDYAVKRKDSHMAFQIFVHALKHKDTHLANQAVEHTIRLPPAVVFQALTPEQFLEWIRFRDTFMHWIDASQLYLWERSPTACFCIPP